MLACSRLGGGGGGTAVNAPCVCFFTWQNMYEVELTRERSFAHTRPRSCIFLRTSYLCWRSVLTPFGIVLDPPAGATREVYDLQLSCSIETQEPFTGHWPDGGRSEGHHATWKDTSGTTLYKRTALTTVAQTMCVLCGGPTVELLFLTHMYPKVYAYNQSN